MWRRRIALAALVLGVVACAEVSDPTHIRRGASPQLVDDLVRFRTTYYFRVFDACEIFADQGPEAYDNSNLLLRKKPGKQLRLIKDSLYRFTMTGKAPAGTSNVHFEAGTLKAWQIDPFGAIVDYDKENNRFYFKSQSESRDDTRLSEQLAVIKRLRDQLGDIKKADNPEAYEIVQSVINARLRDLNQTPAPQDGAATGATDAVKGIPAGSQGCASNGTLRRGFQILGPEGVRTFDQDDRLVMAMSSSGRPLFGALQDLSQRVLSQKASDSDRLLPLALERVRLNEAARALDAGDGATESPEDVGRLIDAVIKALDQDTGGGS